MEPSEIFGKISFLALCGDHLQLPPVPKSSGLLAPLEGVSEEHKVGASMFSRMHFLFEMHTMKRFTDATLISILQKIWENLDYCGDYSFIKYFIFVKDILVI